MIVNDNREKVLKNKPAIFLAGPTHRGAEITPWRQEALELLERNGFAGVVYCPEYVTNGSETEFLWQRKWEAEAMQAADIIVFWVPRDLTYLPGFTTNVEFGYWLTSNKVVYGRPDNAPETRYLDWLYQRHYQVKPYNALSQLIRDVIKKM